MPGVIWRPVSKNPTSVLPISPAMHAHPKYGPNKLRMTLNQAVFDPYLELGGVWLGVVLGSMNLRGAPKVRVDSLHHSGP